MYSMCAYVCCKTSEGKVIYQRIFKICVPSDPPNTLIIYETDALRTALQRNLRNCHKFLHYPYNSPINLY